MSMCSSHKINIHTPQQKTLKFPGGGVFCNAKKFKKMCEVLLEFPEGWGFVEKLPSMGRYGYFLQLCLKHKINVPTTFQVII